MSGERVGFRFKHADAVVKRNPQGRSRRGWVMEPVEQTTSRGTKMPAYRIRWRDSERPEIVLQHMLRVSSRSSCSSQLLMGCLGVGLGLGQFFDLALQGFDRRRLRVEDHLGQLGRFDLADRSVQGGATIKGGQVASSSWISCSRCCLIA